MISSYYYRGTFLQNVLSASQSNVLFVLHNCTFRFADHICKQKKEEFLSEEDIPKAV